MSLRATSARLTQRDALRHQQRHGGREQAVGRLRVAAGYRKLLGLDLAGDGVQAHLKRLLVAFHLDAIARVELEAGDELQLVAVLAEGLAAGCLQRLCVVVTRAMAWSMSSTFVARSCPSCF